MLVSDELSFQWEFSIISYIYCLAAFCNSLVQQCKQDLFQHYELLKNMQKLCSFSVLLTNVATKKITAQKIPHIQDFLNQEKKNWY